MFTNNYIKLQNLMFYADRNAFVACDGGTVNAYEYHAPHHFGNIGKYMKYGRCRNLEASFAGSTNLFSNNNPGVYFGTGSTPAHKSDYKLENPITSGLAITNSNSVEVNSGDGNYTISTDYIVRNTTDSEINIYEIGAFGPICTYSGYYSANSMGNTWSMVLMERTVLTEPITIAPGESKLVTYRLTFNQILNME